METPDSRLDRAYLINFKYQCKDMLDSLRNTNQAHELRQTIQEQKAQIEALIAKVEKLTAAKPTPKRRGRPKKVTNGNSNDDSGASQ